MSNFREGGLNVAISRIPQTDYTTPPTPAAGSFIREEIKTRSQPAVTPATRNNAGYATGYPFGTDSWVEAWQTGWPWPVDLSSQNIGRYLLAAMGKVTTDQPNVGASPTVYRHIFEPLPFLTTSQLPVYALLTQMAASANGINRMVPSMVARSFKMAASGIQRLDGNIDWAGSGEIISPSGVTWATHVNEIQGTQNFFFSRMVEMAISDTNGSNSDTVSCDLKNWNFGVENALADNDWGCPAFVDDDPNLGAIRSQHLLGNQAYMQDWRIKLRNDTPDYEDLMAQREMKLITTLEGGIIEDAYTHKLTVTSYLAKYTSAVDGFEDGFAVVDVKPELLFNVSANKIVEVELINNVVSYTT